MPESSTTFFPRAELFGLIGGIPQSFGGVINATLARMSHLADVEQRDLSLLTKSLGTDPVERQRDLHENGQLSRRVTLRNIWYDLRTMEDHELQQWAGGPHVKDSDAVTVEGPERPAFTGDLVIDRNTGDEPRDRVVCFREDGTLAFMDEGASETPEGWSRRITVFLRSGQQLSSWRAATPLYHAWFDHLTGGRESVIINDSSAFGHVVSRYQRDHVLTVQVIHSNYIDRMRKDSLNAEPFQTMYRLDWFDRVAALTTGQADDLIASGLVHPSRVVAIPNAARPTTASTDTPRDPLRGLLVARLSKEKRPSHTVRAVQRAHTPDLPVEIDIYGDGPLRPSLESLAENLRAGAFIHFHGHEPRAREKFLEASFSVLSSESEGHPLVILESMAAGCIPIAYDVKYGPSLMIEDGIDGFLVAPGDVHMLANRIQRIVAMDSTQLSRMRQAAIAKSQMFSPEQVVRQWRAALDVALTAKQARRQLQDKSLRAELVDAQLNDSALLLTLAVSTSLSEWADAETRLTWISRTHEALGGLAVDSSEVAEDGRLRMEVTLPLAELDEERRTTCDIYLDVVSADFAVRTRVACPSFDAPLRGRSVRLYRTAHGNLSLTLR